MQVITQDRLAIERFGSPREASCCSTALDRAVDSAWFSALGDPTRAGLFACLAKCTRPCTVGELAKCCDVDLSVVSRHLKRLGEAGLVGSEKIGREVKYHVPRERVAARLTELAGLINDPRVDHDVAGLGPQGGSQGGGCCDGCE